MKIKRTMSRWELARRLQDAALRIAAGKPVRIGGKRVLVPDQLVLDEEVETRDGETELEFEIRWPAAEEEPRRTKAARPSRKAR